MERQEKIGLNKCISKKGFARFPQRLEEMLKSKKHLNSISWSSDGTYIIIKNKKSLINILPEYFKSNKFSSFNRQLHLFGFKRTRSDTNEVMISNPNFTRDQNQLKIIKKSIPTTLVSQHEEVKEEMSKILIEQEYLQQQVKILMQIQAKIQSLHFYILKVEIICNQSYLRTKIIGYTGRKLFCKCLLIMARGFSENEGFGTEVQRRQIEFLQFCLDDTEDQEMNLVDDSYNYFTPMLLK